MACSEYVLLFKLTGSSTDASLARHLRRPGRRRHSADRFVASSKVGVTAFSPHRRTQRRRKNGSLQSGVEFINVLSRGHIFSCVRPFYELAVSDLDP
jgi:hypothetical protein